MTYHLAQDNLDEYPQSLHLESSSVGFGPGSGCKSNLNKLDRHYRIREFHRFQTQTQSIRGKNFYKYWMKSYPSPPPTHPL